MKRAKHKIFSYANNRPLIEVPLKGNMPGGDLRVAKQRHLFRTFKTPSGTIKMKTNEL